MNTFRKYTWLLDTLQDAHYGLTFKELQEKWRESGGYEEAKDNQLEERTLHRWRQGILSTFGIEIICDTRHEYRYKVEDVDHAAQAQICWMCHAVNMGSLMYDYKDQRKNILVENVPSGEKYLRPMLDSIKNRKKVRITYHRFQEPQPREPEIIHPLCLKLFQKRWYAVVMYESNKPEYSNPSVRVICLDRITALEPQNGKFKIPDDFDAETYFENDYGTDVGKDLCGGPVKVLLCAKLETANYLRSLPIHASQKEVPVPQKGYYGFEYRMKVTPSLVRHILQRGDEIKVLEPALLRQEVRDLATKIIENNK